MIRNRIFKYEIWLVGILLFMPLILIIFDGGIIRDSISNYVYMKHNQVFYFLLFLSSTMFSNNGALWVKNYNILLGVTLAGVALFPHLEYPIIHFTFAGLFFLGSVFVMIYYSSKKQRVFKVVAGLLILLGMSGYFLLGLYSLFWAEWIGILPISIHFIAESKGISD